MNITGETQRFRTVARRRASRLALTALVTVSLVASAAVPATTLEDEALGLPTAGSDATETSTVEQEAVAEDEPAVDEEQEQEQGPAEREPVSEEESAPEDGPAAEEQEPAAEPEDEPAAEEQEPAAEPEDEPTVEEQEPAAEEESDPDPDEALPQDVPSPGTGSAVITVKVGGDRRANASVGPLAGVTLRLWDGEAEPTRPVDASWATCESDADGDCSFVVPNTGIGGANRNRRFWVVQASAPEGWYTNESLVTGSTTTHGQTPYRFRTGTSLRAGRTYTSGQDFMTSSGFPAVTDSSGVWQSSRVNPTLPETCQDGIDVALVLDLSTSVSTAGAVDDLKASAIGFAEALEGTGSRLALYTFASNAPRSNDATGMNYPLMTVDGNLDTIRDRINGYRVSGYTNWDRGIHQVATSSDDYDLAIVITDGLATVYGSPAAGSGFSTRVIETGQAIFSANALKAQGTRVLAIGVGEGVSGAADNLRAVSGQTGYVAGMSASSADYFQTGWKELAGLLRTLAKGATCQAHVTLEKVAEPYAGESGPAAGWTFSATPAAGSAVVTPEGSQVTDSSGSVGYNVSFDRPHAAASTVRLEELVSDAQRADGWHLTALTCTANGSPVATVRDGDGTSVQVGVGDDVSCTFTNTQTLVPGVTVVKRAWDVPSAERLDGAPEILPGAPVTDGRTITWTYTVRNTGQTVLEDLTVADDQGVPVTCPSQRLDVGKEMVCTGSGPVSAGP